MTYLQNCKECGTLAMQVNMMREDDVWFCCLTCRDNNFIRNSEPTGWQQAVGFALFVCMIVVSIVLWSSMH